MAKLKPHVGMQEMEAELGYKIPIYPDDEVPRFYSDLHLVPRSNYEKLEREYRQSASTRLLGPSGVPENQLASRLPTRGTTKKIERAGASVEIYRHSHQGLYPFSVDMVFGFGLDIPLLFTEAETARTVLVSELPVDVTYIQTPGFFELPIELRLKIYEFAVPRGQWCINNIEDFDQDILPRCLGDPSGYYFPLSKDISLLLASKRLRQEALPVAFRRTTFRLDDMDDLTKLLVAVGQIGRANIESLHFPWESRSDLRCRWERFPEAEDNHLKLPTMHVSKTMQLFHQCSRLRRIRVLFDEELMLTTPRSDFKADEGIRCLCSMQGLQQVELLGLNGEDIKHCPLMDWLRAKLMDGDKKTMLWRWGIRTYHSHRLTLPTYALTPMLLAQRNSQAHDVEGWTAPDWSVIGGHYDAAKALLSHDDEASEVARLNQTLILAAEAGDDKAVEKLLQRGAEINGIDEEGSTALDFAVPEGKEKVVRLLLNRGANPNSRDNYGHTALHWALAYPAIAKLLLQYGATIDARNRRKQTPLLWSAKEAQVDMLVLLTESGADVNACDEHGTTVLHAAAAKGNETMVKFLLDKGAHATLEDRDGWTPVQTALIGGHCHLLPVFTPKFSSCQSIAGHMARILADENNAAWLQELAMAKSEGSVQVSGLRVAVNRGHSERILALLSAGEDVNACDSIGGSTALTLATSLGRLGIAKILIENGADVNRSDATRTTALHIAARDGHEDIAALLVSSGAAVDRRLHSWTPLLLASRDCHHDCSTRIAELLIANGADVKAADYHGRTALHWAALWSQPLLARELLQRGARVDVQDRWGMTPLVWASAGDHTRLGNPTTNLLLDNNVDPNMETKEGYRAIHLAALAGDVELLDQLLRHGADPEARAGTIGLKPLDIARIMEKSAAITVLEAWGAQYSQPSQWEHAQGVALAWRGNGRTGSHGSRLLDITAVPNEVICVESLYQALRGLRGAADARIEI